MNSLSFHDTQLTAIPHNGQPWLTAAQIGAALEYADDKAVQRIYSRHSDEFTESMTGVVKLTIPSGMQDVRIFSLRGAHLIAMFSRTTLAKAFRRWVLDILDEEASQAPRIAIRIPAPNGPDNTYCGRLLVSVESDQITDCRPLPGNAFITNANSMVNHLKTPGTFSLEQLREIAETSLTEFSRLANDLTQANRARLNRPR